MLFNLVFSFVSIWIVQHTSQSILWTIILIYGLLRVFEIIVYQINVLLFDEYRANKSSQKYTLRSYRRTVLLLLHNFAEIIFWFAASYTILSTEFSLNYGKSMIRAIHSSFVVMTNFGSPNIQPSSNIGLYIIWTQSVAGLFMTLISLARFIGLLPRPETLDKFEKENK